MSTTAIESPSGTFGNQTREMGKGGYLMGVVWKYIYIIYIYMSIHIISKNGERGLDRVSLRESHMAM
jgi:hypothetical protein